MSKEVKRFMLTLGLMFLGAFCMTFAYEIEGFKAFLGDTPCEDCIMSDWEWGIRHWILMIATVVFYFVIFVNAVNKLDL